MNMELINRLKQELPRKFELKNMGKVCFCLSIQFECQRNEVKISQRGYVYDILKRYCMSECNSVSTPEPTTEAGPEEMKFPYRELIGALTYLLC